MTFKFIRATCVAACVFSASSAFGQCSVDSLCNFIHDLQVGHVAWAYIAPPLAQTILAQTGGTGRYNQLAQLRDPVSVLVVGSQPLPRGLICGYLTQFQAATLEWQLAYDPQLMQAMFFRYAGPGVGVPSSPPASEPEGWGHLRPGTQSRVARTTGASCTPIYASGKGTSSVEPEASAKGSGCADADGRASRKACEARACGTCAAHFRLLP